VPDVTHSEHILFKRLARDVMLATEQADQEVSLQALIRCAVEATTTDHAEESVQNVLSRETRVSRSFYNLCYWSSKGSESCTHSDAITFQLSHPLSVVRCIKIRPFEAHFQRGSPIYSSAFVRFSFGTGRCETRDLVEITDETEPGGAQDAVNEGWSEISDVYPMEQVNALQTFEIPPTLCCGGFVRIELLGKKQKQDIDGLYYVCLSHVQVTGVPLSNFGMVQDAEEAVSIPLLHYDPPPFSCEKATKQNLEPEAMEY